MSYKKEFETIELILDSQMETRGVDAFILSWIKAEKQIRRIFTFLIFQNDLYTISDCNTLRKILADNYGVYFRGFVKGINLILPSTIKDIYGSEYDKDIAYLFEFTNDRNKIFHGQITANGLSRIDLLERVNHIKKWSETLGNKLIEEIGYDGFSDSFNKTTLSLNLRNLDKFETFEKYKNFIKNELQG
mgnify:CR=1 FL=1